MVQLKFKILSVLLIFFSLLEFFGCTPLGTRSSPQRGEGIFHVVGGRENLFRIGKAYDVPYRELARINGIADPDRIRRGQRIFVPGARRQLAVEIITPADVSLERPRAAARRAEEANGFIWPVGGEISSNFGPREGSFHDGIDIAAPEGTAIRVIERGQVLYSDQLRGYGNLLIVGHSNGFVSVYAHNRKNLARPGASVARGQVVAEVGTTGRVSGPHLHFEIRIDNVARNPLYYLPEL